MEYPYFTAAQQPYQFLNLPPTPSNSNSHANSANSDEYSNSPPVRAQNLSYVAYSNSNHSYADRTPLTTPQDAFESFQAYDYTQFNQHNPHQNGLAQVKPPTPTQSLHAPTPVQKPLVSGFSNGIGFDMHGDNSDKRRGSNSDDDDMTPAQKRRQEQNRQAQRNFRERKERRVKDLETKLALLETTSSKYAEENALLRSQLQRASTENEILKATSSSHSHSPRSSPPDIPPMRYTPTDFYSQVLQAHENKTPSHRIVHGEGGERLLAAGAAWDFIQRHPLYARGLVDVGDVTERLQRVAQCDGQGPVFEERAVIEAIEKSVASGSDELL